MASEANCRRHITISTAAVAAISTQALMNHPQIAQSKEESTLPPVEMPARHDVHPRGARGCNCAFVRAPVHGNRSHQDRGYN